MESRMAKLRALSRPMVYGEGHGAFTLPGFGVHYAPDLTIEPTSQLQMATDLEQEGAVGQRRLDFPWPARR